MKECIIHIDPYVPFDEIELTDEEIAECMEQIKNVKIKNNEER